MPVTPTNPVGCPDKDIYAVPFAAVATAGNDLTTQACVVQRTGYLTAASIVGAANNGADTNSRTFTVVDPTTRAVTDVIVVDQTKNKGPWVAATAYSTGDMVSYNNNLYVAIAGTTGNTPGVSPASWTQVNAVGLDWATSLTGAFTQDDVGKAFAGTGFTSATIIKVQDSQTVQLSSPNSAVRNALSITVGSSRTLATLALTNGVNIAAGVPKAITPSTTDTRVFKGDVLQLVSTHVGTGIADAGGTLILEVTAFSEGSD